MFSKKLKRIIILIVSLPITLLIKLTGYKIANIATNRIGHLIPEVDGLIKLYKLENLNPKKIILIINDDVANKKIIKYFEKYITISKNKKINIILENFKYNPLINIDCTDFMRNFNVPGKIYEIYSNWGERAPLFVLNEHDNNKKKLLFNNLGIPSDRWIVCLHSRDNKFNNNDLNLYNFRDTDINIFNKAIEYIYSIGGICVRMGDKSMMKLTESNLNNNFIIDYATSIYKSESADIIMAASCKFFIGTNSGASTLATMFGRPVIAINMAPSANPAFTPNDFYVPMIYHDLTKEKNIDFKTVNSGKLANFFHDQNYQNKIKLISAEENEVLFYIIEFIDFIELNKNKKTNLSNNNLNYRKYFNENSFGLKSQSRIPEIFFEIHNDLMEN